MLQSRGSLEELLDDLNVCQGRSVLADSGDWNLSGRKGWRTHKLINGYIRFLRKRNIRVDSPRVREASGDDGLEDLFSDRFNASRFNDSTNEHSHFQNLAGQSRRRRVSRLHHRCFRGHGGARCGQSHSGDASERPCVPLELQSRKCGWCSAEINGMPKLMCMTRLSDLPLEKPVTVQPLKTFPPVKDLITDVSWNFRVKKRIKKFKPRAPDAPDGSRRMQQEDIDRVQEFRKCIECFLCQDVCHVLRDTARTKSSLDRAF